MDITVFVAVLSAAVLHATWNAIVKGSADKFLSMTAVVLGHVPLALLALAWVDHPDLSSWPYIVASAILHAGYQLFLLWSYRVGDLSQVYPIARGTAPILVTLVSIFVLGETLTTAQLMAVTLIGIGIMSLVFVRGSDGLRNGKAALLALITSGFVASYTLVDGLGARASNSSVGFYVYATALKSWTKSAPDACFARISS